MPIPDASSRPRRVNRLGLTPSDYKGKPSTLCKGCGHDAISSQLIRALFESEVRPHQVAKLSGIGCSSKTPAYFLNHSHGFNAVHGRMPSVATGAVLANRQLVAIGVSGDGDTASIGIGQFVHLVRRNLPLIYIVENNGVYGLTKGQFSATADEDAALRSGEVNKLPSIDLCGMAIELGATYVGRSFAGDPKQLVALLRGALAHNGTAVLDILSPCVTFNNHAGSTKSYTWGKDNEEPIHILDFVPAMDPIEVEYEEGTDREVQLHDGSWVRLRKLEREYDPTDRRAARELLLEASDKDLFLTGLLYLDTSKRTFLDSLEMCDEPLALLTQEQLRPPPEILAEVVASYR